LTKEQRRTRFCAEITFRGAPLVSCILCIDDEQPGLSLRKALLESAGYRVLAASSGREGIRLFESEPVDAVILDYWMAGMNGLAVAREMKRLRPKVPIIGTPQGSPRTHRLIAASIQWPERIMQKIDKVFTQ